MTKLTCEDLTWFIDNFAYEYIHSCILMENLLCDDYPEYYNPFLEIFEEFTEKRKDFDASGKLGEVYNQLYKHINMCFNLPDCNVSALIGEKPTTSEGFHEIIVKLRRCEEGDAL